MYLGEKVKIDRFDGEYFEVDTNWLLDVVWEKYNMSLDEFMMSYDRKDSDYILALATNASIELEMKYDEDYLYY